MQRLYGDPPVWRRVMENIASGRSQWIDLALSLKAGSAERASVDLRNAMFRALGRNPSYVLEHAQPDYPLAVLCRGRAEPLPTYKAALAELEAVRKAVEKVRAEPLQARKYLCLAEIEEGRTQLRRVFGLARGTATPSTRAASDTGK